MFGSGFSIWTTIVALAAIAVQVLFTICIWNDTQRLKALGRDTVLLTPFAWAGAALVAGLAAVALYWLVHYSSFAGPPQPGAKP